MNNWRLLLDLDGTASWLTPGGLRLARLPDDLGGRVMLLTDYGDAPFGTEMLPAHTSHIAPVVEKRLRDQGDIDGLAQVMVHACERQGEMARSFYTAVPVQTYLRYRGWVERHPDHLLMFPLAEALQSVAVRHELMNGVLAFVHGSCIDVLVRIEGQVVSAARLRRFDDGEAEFDRLVASIERMWRSQVADARPADCLLVELEAGEGRALKEAMARGTTLRCGVAPLPVRTLFAGLRPARADISQSQRALYACSLALPWVAMAMVLLCVVTAVYGLGWRAEAEALSVAMSQAASPEQSRLQVDIEAALHEAQSMEQKQRALVDFVRLSARVRQTPDPANLVNHLRQATPEGIYLSEAGVVADDEGVLVIVVGRSESVAAPFDAESRFVKSLEDLGYRVEKREIEGGTDSSMFRLALTWSEPCRKNTAQPC